MKKLIPISSLLFLGLISLGPRLAVAETPRLSDSVRSANDQYHRDLLEFGPQDLRTRYFKYKLKQAEENYIAASASNTHAWAEEDISLDGSTTRLYDRWEKFKDWIIGKRKPRKTDLAFNFVETNDNEMEFLAGNDAFWPRMVEDVTNAKSSINIQVFGVTPDNWVWTFAKLLAQKASEGVKVRILADRFGARMYAIEGAGDHNFLTNTILKDGPEKIAPGNSLFQFLHDHGVETVLVPLRFNDGMPEIDHRKSYVIDGKIAYNTGYTLQQEMHDIKYDEGVRIVGSLVHQFQLSFFSSWIYNGGEIDRSELDIFDSRYFPYISHADGAKLTSAGMKVNVPSVRNEITEEYFQAIQQAKKYIYITNPYFASGRIKAELWKAAKAGTDVRVVVPKVPVNKYYSTEDDLIFGSLTPLGVKSYAYLGPKKYGFIHAKGLLVDGNFVSIGSCNMDPWSLFYNDEVNVVSSDPDFVRGVQTEMFDYLFQYSEPYKIQKVQGLIGEMDQGAAQRSVDFVRAFLEWLAN